MHVLTYPIGSFSKFGDFWKMPLLLQLMDINREPRYKMMQIRPNVVIPQLARIFLLFWRSTFEIVWKTELEYLAVYGRASGLLTQSKICVPRKSGPKFKKELQISGFGQNFFVTDRNVTA